MIFSSSPIPGNEKAVSRVVNELSQKGANVIVRDAHVSGHACQEELKLIYSLLKPKYAIPVHGEYRHLKANAAIAEALGVEKENIAVTNVCTNCNPDMLWSHRATKGQRGSLAAFMALK